ncbi:MAG: ACT domain-containing protein [Selenomonadaceae bacterium]|nr:ACT domain-containing protein [Selenomonadaceae bacterium]MBR6343833.1 ACT domain-containing protein [Selenomonadaceae bacterium]
MSAKQISVFLENKPGTLKKLTSVLASHSVNIRALSLADTKDFGIVRMLVDDVFDATNVLKEADFIAALTSVLVFEISDETGGLDNLLQSFSDAKINIEYMYAFAGKQGAYMIFRVADTKKAEAALQGKGLHPLSQEDIASV